MKGQSIWRAGFIQQATAICVAIIALGFGFTSPAAAQGKKKTTSTPTGSSGNSGSSNSGGIGSSGVGNSAREEFTYFPSAKKDDGRFLSLAGAGQSSLSGDILEFGLGVPKTFDSLKVDIFDGETGGLWDQGTVPLEFTIIADPIGDGTGDSVVGTWSGSVMKDNDWYRIGLKNMVGARSSDSNYYYLLRVRLTDPTLKGLSNFKIRTSSTAELLPLAFSFTAPMFTEAEKKIIYPNWPNLTPTNYDGTWDFYLSVPEIVEDIDIWDGDLDYGSSIAEEFDTDDANTSNGQLPDWADGTPAVKEGVAFGGMRYGTNIKNTGLPADDNANPAYRRSPSVRYVVTDPNGTKYANNDPSGNMEWEKFSISTRATFPAEYDYLASVLPTGVYKVHVEGMDLGNLNAWRMGHSILGVRKNGKFGSLKILGVDSSGKVQPMLQAPSSIGGTGTIGFWKNHSEDWPVAGITIGSKTYSMAEAITILGSSGGDKSGMLARQLIAAKLNVMTGSESSCIIATIIAADAWLSKYPVGSSNPDWKTGEPLATALDEYNNGRSGCAEHRGSMN